MDHEKCFICDHLLRGEGVSLGRKGLTTLIEASRKRNDNKCNLLTSVDSVKVHESCRKNYTRYNSIKSDLKRQLEAASESLDSKRLRSLSSQFDFKSQCFLCAEFIDEKFKTQEKKKPLNRRRIVYGVRSIGLKGKLFMAAEKRADEWADQVKNRLSTVSDLVAAEGIYHHVCYLKFFSRIAKKTRKSGHPGHQYVVEAMEEIRLFLESNDDCQHSMSELMSAVSGQVPTERCIKKKLMEIYGDRIIITERYKSESIVCFLDTGRKKLADSWYKDRKRNAEEEKERIVVTAAEIIREEIQSTVFDSESYPPNDCFLENAATDVSYLLLKFLIHLTHGKTRKSYGEKTQKKCVAIAHAITHIVRPRSFLSCILDSLSLFIHRRFASKNLVKLLSSLGFCSSYHNAQQLELSAIHQDVPETETAFHQLAFDNADFNVSTLDGLNTFHAMGGIACVTPASSLKKGKEFPRLKIIPPAETSGKFGVLPVETYEKKNSGLGDIILASIPDPPKDALSTNAHDILWLFAKHIKISGIPGWKGYMQCINKGNYSEKSKIVPLPFINAPPTDIDTIYTSLRYALNYCEQANQKTVIVTFDQPLYMKCKDILASSCNDPQLSKCVVRLGGFHLLMSFLGCIGYLMSGSGLKELLCTIYAPLSVEKMLEGKAYSRAVRGHIMVQRVLSGIILSRIDLSIEERNAVNEFTENFSEESPSIEAISHHPHINCLAKKFEKELLCVKKNGPTAALWTQYIEMVTLMKMYINAERCGDWNNHLLCVRLMIPYFHACGDFPYAKACHLYLQDMLNLKGPRSAV